MIDHNFLTTQTKKSDKCEMKLMMPIELDDALSVSPVRYLKLPFIFSQLPHFIVKNIKFMITNLHTISLLYTQPDLMINHDYCIIKMVFSIISAYMKIHNL